MDSNCIFLMRSKRVPFVSPFYFCVIIILIFEGIITPTQSYEKTINIGAIVDLDSRIGKEQKIAMQIAAKKFNNDNLQISLYFMDFNRSLLQTAIAAQELVEKNKVQVILVAIDNWATTSIIAQVGTTSQIPILSLISSPPITFPYASLKFPYLIQFSHNSTQQIQNIASIINSYLWRRVILVYEDNSSNSGSITLLIQNLQKIGSQIEYHLILPPFSSILNPKRVIQNSINKFLNEEYYSRVFIVLKVSFPYVNHLFEEVKRFDLMTKDSVWIIGESISNVMPSFETSTLLNMEGAIGIMNKFDNSSKDFQIFEAEFGLKFVQEYEKEIYLEPSFEALIANDAINAIIDARNSVSKANGNGTSSKSFMREILSTSFTGLSGKVSFNQEQNTISENASTRVVNIANGNYHEILDFTSDIIEEKDIKEVSSGVIWPGNLSGDNVIPKGWVMPTYAKPLKIGVPIAHYYKNFINYTFSSNNNSDFQGFCIDIFHEVLKLLAYQLPYEFIAYNGSYDDLVNLVHNKSFDAGVGDITILAERSELVDFTFPFEESGLSIVIPVAKSYSSQGAWIFLEPYTSKMWFVTFCIFLYTIIMIWILEHRQKSQEFEATLSNQLSTTAWFAFNSIYFTLRERISTTQARVVIIFWLFIVLVLTTSYTANLSSMITNDRLNQTTIDIKMLQRTNVKIGYDNSAFYKNYLVSLFDFDSNNIVGVESNLEEIHKEFQIGNIGAACLEYVYAQLLLTRYCNYYIMTTPMHRFGGFGFIFPRGSPIAIDISEALLKLTENGTLKELKNRNFNINSDCTNTIDDASNNNDTDQSSLRLDSFRVPFYVSLITTTLCLLLSFKKLCR